MQTMLYLGYSTMWANRWGVGGVTVSHAHPELTSQYVMHEQLSLSTFDVSAENESACPVSVFTFSMHTPESCVRVAFT